MEKKITLSIDKSVRPLWLNHTKMENLKPHRDPFSNLMVILMVATMILLIFTL